MDLFQIEFLLIFDDATNARTTAAFFRCKAYKYVKVFHAIFFVDKITMLSSIDLKALGFYLTSI